MTVRRLALLATATIALGTGAAFAATLDVASNHLWGGSQTLTKATCTVTGSASTADTYVDENKPTNNFANGTTMLAQPDAGSRKWTLVRFDLSGCSIPTTGGADTATLQLRVTTAPKQNRTLTVTPILTTWAATTTWNGAQSLTYASSATTTFQTGTANNTTIGIPVTVDVDALIKSPSASFGWRISDNGSAATSDTTTFASANAGSNRPTLVVNYEK